MFQTRYLENKINHLHERCFRIIYNNKYSNFEEMLVKDNSINHINIQTISVEIHKVAIGMSQEIMNNIFKLRNNKLYYLRHTPQFLVDPSGSAFNGSESTSYLRPKIWEQMSSEIKHNYYLDGFEKLN